MALVEVDASTKQALLELVCFYNEEDQLSEELIEERWFKLQAQAKEQSNRPQGKTWKSVALSLSLCSISFLLMVVTVWFLVSGHLGTAASPRNCSRTWKRRRARLTRR